MVPKLAGIVLLLLLAFAPGALAGGNRPRYEATVRYAAPTWFSNDRILCVKHVGHYRLYYGLMANISKGTAKLFKTEVQLVSMDLEGADEHIHKSIVMNVKDGAVVSSSEAYFVGEVASIDYHPVKRLIAVQEIAGRLFLMKEDGTDLRKIAESAGRPAFSPDGHHLQYTSDGKVWLYDVGTGEHRVLIENATGGPWSPDGKRIAFSRKVNHTHDVFLYDLDKHMEVNLEELNRDGIYAIEDWSPDGTMLATPGGIYSLQGEYLKIPNKPYNARWSSDGKHLVGEPSGKGAIAVIKSDGSDLKVLR